MARATTIQSVNSHGDVYMSVTTTESTARAILADPAYPLTEWKAGRDRGVPIPSIVPALRRAGWPVDTIEIDLPREGRTSRGGPGTVRQPVTVVPVSWLRALATARGLSLAAFCRATVGEVRSPGRPKTLPPGTRPRMIRMTDAEFARAKEFVRELRGEKPKDSQAK